MTGGSKRYIECKKLYDTRNKYLLKEGIELLKSFPKTKFDESVEVVMKLGIDPKRSDQMLRGSISLPKGIGKELRVVVFARGEKAEEAKKAGAVEAGAEELIKKIEGGWMDFDVAIAAPEMMRQIGKLGRLLGPQGKMPSPKSGTVTDSIGEAVKEFKAGKIEYRNDAGGNVHALAGKLSFSTEDLVANIESFVSHIVASKPASAKGTYVQKVTISSTMSPGINVVVER
ncbi:MAG: 50S ribosomal protein L1 [Candidatus Brocadiales bacterium]